MKRWIIFIFLLSFGILNNANAITAKAKQKYPYPLLTDDYGILNENDLGAYTWGLSPRPFSKEDSGEYNYWQCVPREHVSLTLRDMGSFSEDSGTRDTIGDLVITMRIKPEVIHKYEMRRSWTVSDFQKDFNHWRKLMKGEKYVCIAGSFGSCKKKVMNGVTKEICGWIFDKIKTKKGCAGYWDNCNLTYAEYKQKLSQQKKD
jgi:hypothetical protein